ncbi:HD-GYP domain-containing protein [Bacillus sp. FJAT-49736]|uniref:HD-GYP domain-containing protein n=1 Tax=Bacillus sp. FJAT-49736 TaxID=2833582 RepID=UPI001BC92B2E|nr:HD-GYP domain-containing protein [Bacillus sp. FJAT-49736]MBS4175183.1 HD-GYP domain-containing protein [Bacillus sp. FJAT-49736]
MKIRVGNLKEGCILEDDVMGMTGSPIIPKNTIIDKSYIKVLKAFNIDEVSIENKMADGSFLKVEGNEQNIPKEVKVDNKLETSSFEKQYNNAVQRYKSDFKNWQSGAMINIASVRDYLYPLLESIEDGSKQLLSIHNYSNKDEYIYHHSIAVGLLSSLIAKKMNYSKGQYLQAALAGCLANVGMSKVSPNIIKKEGSLVLGEMNEVQEHVGQSLKMIQNISLLKPETKLAIFQHHERLDGSGYPMKLKGDKIYPLSRIVSVADVFHALISDRPYHKKVSAFQAIEILNSDCFGQFDISVINILLNMISTNLVIGTKIKLSNNEIAEIMFTKQSALTRPLVKIVDNGEIVDLEKARDLSIKEII